jgi:hypothetical protein
MTDVRDTIYELECDQSNGDVQNDTYVSAEEVVVYDDTRTDSPSLIDDVFGIDGVDRN